MIKNIDIIEGITLEQYENATLQFLMHYSKKEEKIKIKNAEYRTKILVKDIYAKE